MKTRFLIRELALICKHESVRLLLGPGVSLLVGPVGTGKSSLLELIKYGLGGNGTLTGAVKEGVTGVEITAFVTDQDYMFRRSIGGKFVEVWQKDDDVLLAKAPVSARKKETIAQTLLDLLRIPALRITRSRARPTGDTVALSFRDVYRYLYLDQAEIDRSVVGHLESYLQPKRMATFELFYGLRNKETARLETLQGKAATQLQESRSAARQIRGYLASANQLSEEDLTLQRAELTGELALARQQLGEVKAGLKQATDSEKAARDGLRDRYRELWEREARAEAARAQMEERQNLIAQLTVDEQKYGRSAAAHVALLPIDFQICPNCLQGLARGRGSSDKCYVCLQEMIAPKTSEAIEEQRRRIALQIGETRELLEVDKQEFDKLRREVEESQIAIRNLEEEIDSRLTEFISPQLERVQGLSEHAATLAEKRRGVERELEYWDAFKKLEKQIEATDAKLLKLKQELEVAKIAQEQAREQVSELSEIFEEILTYFELPWLETAYIDKETFLPIVNGQKFEHLTAGSGGMPTLVNDAYHLSGLVFSLRHSINLFPRFLIIDSPRKGLGRHPANEIMVQRIYGYFRRLLDTYEDKFQLIVADNDVPKGFDYLVKLSLSYKKPLVPGIKHPGKGKVETLGADPDEYKELFKALTSDEQNSE